MKIKDILRGLLSGEDFSDHSTGKEDGNAPLHTAQEECYFCDAWREALTILGSDFLYHEFDYDEKVTLPGGIRGRVMGTEAVIRVEVQNGETGPWAVGLFRPDSLRPWVEPETEFTFWAERGGEGDVWERRESDSLMRLVKFADENAPATETPAWGDCRWRFAEVERRYGLLSQVLKP